MKKITLLVVILSAAFMSGHTFASPASDALGVCMIDNLNGKERKELGKWIFLGMSAHPEISHLTNATESIRDESDQYIGNLITRLLTEDCVTETKTAMAENSSVAITSAFELVGRVAMQELTTDGTVSSALSRFEKYLDNEKFQSLQTPN